LKLLINAQPDMQVVGEGARAADIGALLTGAAVDVLLLDISMPGGSGLSGLRQWPLKAAGMKVVILTMLDDVAVARAALAGGAVGYVLKQAAHADLLVAIRAAHRGGVFVDPSVAGQLMAMPPRLQAKLLSDREQQVLKLVAQGYSNQHVADCITLSVKTVETYRARIAEKLGLHTRAEITRYALVSGMLSASEVRSPA
jgi:DNA-binding NarL/FixJ family response regulator